MEPNQAAHVPARSHRCLYFCSFLLLVVWQALDEVYGMPLFRYIAMVGGVCWVISILSLSAASSALIVIGTTGSASVSLELAGVAQKMHDGMVQRGLADGDIEILGSDPQGPKVTKDVVLASLAKHQNMAASDEFWLILLGFSGQTEEDEPAFQVHGPRLTAAELKSALDSIPARQFVFVGTSDSGDFIPVLLNSNRTVLSATRENGEIDLPRFPEAWAAALKSNPRAGWKEIAAAAAANIGKFYTANSLAMGEHALLGDAATGRVLEAPFGADSLAPVSPVPQSDGSMALLNASDIKVEIRKPNAEWEKQPATPETKALIEAARAVPNPEGFSSLLLEQRLGYRMGDDSTGEDFIMQRIYLARDDGVARWANFLLPQDPPAVTTKLEAARIIQPDGSSTVFNPSKLPPATDYSSGMSNALTMVYLPDAHAGCLIEIAYHTRHLLEADLPELSEELPVQMDIPVLKTELQLQIPDKGHVHFKLRNDSAPPVESTQGGMHLLTWNLKDLPAFEPLPYDPPARDFLVALDISSLDSWDAFAQWYRRLAQGSDIQDATVKAKADELAEDAPTRLNKICKAFEFVSALRYVAIEFGVNGFRPRTPALVLQNRYGDCKDKSNLLIALLADMGIEAQFCLLNRGSDTDISFPSWQFNHAIAYVPKAPDAGQPDDLWLDTTDSTAPFPTLSPGDIGRPALVFDHDSARFLNVATTGDEVTEMTEQWSFRQQTDGSWNGTLESSWSGLAEYDQRGKVRGLSPQQRDFVLQTDLEGQLEDSDFTNLNLTAADDLSLPFCLKAEIKASSLPCPRPGFAVESIFAPPLRDRPLLLNNGQKLHLIQTLDLVYSHGDPAATPAPLDASAGGVHVRAAWEKAGDHGWRRTADLKIDDPLIAETDYASIRRMLQNWTAYLTHEP